MERFVSLEVKIEIETNKRTITVIDEEVSECSFGEALNKMSEMIDENLDELEDSLEEIE